jgi:hypothetical protein
LRLGKFGPHMEQWNVGIMVEEWISLFFFQTSIIPNMSNERIEGGKGTE